MVSLLNTFAWCIAFVLATVPMMIDFDYSIFSIIIFFGTKWILFPRKKILQAVDEWSHQEKTAGARVEYFSSTSIPTNEPIIGEKSSEKEQPVSVTATTSDAIVSNIPEEHIEARKEPSRLRLWIGNFFSERPLAKVGGILLFLGALFFLYLIFDLVGPVGKICIGLLFGFFLIGTGLYLDKKEIIIESRVLFGIGIAVNFLTILSGRHLLSTTLGSGIPLFSDTLTTVCILMNTALAVVLSLVYRSRVLLGFAFIFAYLTPFLIGSDSSSAILLTIYTTILTVAIALINTFYAKQSTTENISYLQGIGTIGMTVLLSIVSLDASMQELIVLFIGLSLSTCALAIVSYRAKLSPLSVCIGAYIVLFVSTLAGSSFIVIPFGIIGLLLMIVYFSLQSLLSLTFLTLFGGLSFILGLLGFWIDGGSSIYLLLMTGASVFCILSIVIFRTASILLGSVSIIGFGVLILLGMGTVSVGIDGLDITEIILTKCMSIFLLIGAGVFTLRLKNGFLFFLAIVLSGILMIYPNTFEIAYIYSTIAITLYLVLSLLIPYIMTRDDRPIMHPSFLLGSLPLGALIVSYGLYEIGVVRFPGLILGLAYILLAGIYLIYAMITGSRYFPHGGSPSIGTEGTATGSNTLLILFALPLSLFTLALAFVFGDTPGIMSLAWIMESSILYLVSVRMREVKIFIAASLVFFIGVIEQITVMLHIIQEDWFMFALLILMLISVFSSLVIIARGEQKLRTLYDILHIVSICIIGYGIGEIIPSTGTGWSIFGPAVFLLIITPVYQHFGKAVQKIFLSLLLGGLCLVFIGKFDSLIKELGPLIIQGTALGIILSIGYLGYRSREYMGYMNMSISVLGCLIISSLYIDHFFATFAVSIYLTIIASILIIRGISTSNTILRTIGLYIGTFALMKILGYDIWEGSYGTIVRVIALMMAGGIMIYLSQLYGKYVTRSWSEEFSLAHIVTSMGGASTNEGDTPSDIPDDMGSSNHPFSPELEHELENTSTEHLSGVRFLSNGGDIFTVKCTSVIRLALHITNTLGKKVFLPHELDSTYVYVIENLESTLPKKDLDSLLMKLKSWIEKGGSIDFTEKK